MSLNMNAIMDEDYFNNMWEGDEVDSVVLEHLINAASTAFEIICKRNLIERTYTFTLSEQDAETKIEYNLSYTTFDAPKNNIFWFPTYPVASITSITVSGTAVTVANDYTADDGYVLYSNNGKLIYNEGFDYPYLQNVQIKWKGGYSSSSFEIAHLRYLMFLTMKDLLNAPANMQYQSETIGQYSYKTVSPNQLAGMLQGLSPKVFADLSKYRREAIG